MLKQREKEILQLLADGLTNQEIGKRLNLATDTVRWYNKSIFKKLSVGNRTQAVQAAFSNGLLATGINESSPKNHTPNPKALRSPIRYVRNGDVHVAFMTIGEGPTDLIFFHGFLSHLEIAWEQPRFVDFFERLAQCGRIILFDKRGMGLSDRIQGAPTLENTIDDALCVLNAVDSQQAYIMGTSEGAAAAVLLAATFPERVQGLILYGATPMVMRDGDQPSWATKESTFNAFLDGLQTHWGDAWALENFAPSLYQDDAFRSWWSKILRAASSPASVRAVLENVGRIDIRGLLPQMKTRTLIIHKSEDHMVPIEAGRYLAAHMPNASMIELPGADHIYFIDADALLAAVIDFVQDVDTIKKAETWIAIILQILPTKDGLPAEALQLELREFGLRHSLLIDERLVAIFESPSKAFHCAQTLRANHRFGPMRISLHVGECDLIHGQPNPIALEQSKQATDFAREGEIIITQTLRDILVGSNLEFVRNANQSSRKDPEHLQLYSLV